MRAMMKSSLSGPFLLLIVLISSSSVAGLGSVVSKSYPHIKTPQTWRDAQSQCRSKYTDLAIFYHKLDTDRLLFHDSHVWIRVDSESENTEVKLLDKCPILNSISRQTWRTSCDARRFFFCKPAVSSNETCRLSPNPLMRKTWLEAQQYCREESEELTLSDQLPSFDCLREVFSCSDFLVWIGLHRQGTDWRWSSGLSNYLNWDASPNDDGCVLISSFDRKMTTRNCSDHFTFVCVKDNLLLVKKKKTWEEALEYCRAYTSPTRPNHRYDLVSVQPGDDQNYIMISVMKAETEEVWVGLRFLADHWMWVTGADMLYTGLPQCPRDKRHCGVLKKTLVNNVEASDCAERKNFLCYKKRNS